MSPARHFQDLLSRVAWWVLILAVLTGGWLCTSAWKVPGLSTVRSPADVLPSPEPLSSSTSPRAIDWSVFRSLDGTGAGGSLSGRFRLAGTFFAYSEGVSDTRKAILDDLLTGVQRIVSETERLGEVEIVRIFRDRIVLRDGVGEEQLWLSFSTRRVARPGPPAGTNDLELAKANVPVEANRFGGVQVGDNRWVFNRQALLDYYQELRDEPERLVKVFDSLKPVYDNNRRISGYRLGIDGEREFFDATGLKEGDVVRAVNSMEMRNRRRAEFLIGQFVTGHANAFVFDVDREGESVKFTYEVR